MKVPTFADRNSNRIDLLSPLRIKYDGYHVHALGLSPCLRGGMAGPAAYMFATSEKARVVRQC